MVIRRGSIFYVNLGKGVGSVQSGTRPVLVIQNNIGNEVTVGEQQNIYNMPASKEMQLAEEKAKYDE